MNFNFNLFFKRLELIFFLHICFLIKIVKIEEKVLSSRNDMQGQ